jgi:hypothetical protein|tara:strand:- start:2126 stop:2284 length:159 start_codon:yes stop_codon:yes gene_type:complete
MRKIVQEYLENPSKAIYARLTTMEQRYVDGIRKADSAPGKDDKKKKSLTGIG